MQQKQRKRTWPFACPPAACEYCTAMIAYLLLANPALLSNCSQPILDNHCSIILTSHVPHTTMLTSSAQQHCLQDNPATEDPVSTALLPSCPAMQQYCTCSIAAGQLVVAQAACHVLLVLVGHVEAPQPDARGHRAETGGSSSGSSGHSRNDREEWQTAAAAEPCVVTLVRMLLPFSGC
jgi:hypothetical protein